MNANELLTVIRDRLATCEIYINRRALVGQNTVVVSSYHHARGVETTTIDGQQKVVLQPFTNNMPTCYSPEDADTLVKEMNQHLEATGADERVYAMNHIDWWKAEKAEKESALEFLNKNQWAIDETAH